VDGEHGRVSRFFVVSKSCVSKLEQRLGSGISSALADRTTVRASPAPSAVVSASPSGHRRGTISRGHRGRQGFRWRRQIR
jgi:hypothetical protein